MPTRCNKDDKGCFCAWGSKTKYYYECGNEEAAQRAKAKADAQGRAIRSRGYQILDAFLKRFS